MVLVVIMSTYDGERMLFTDVMSGPFCIPLFLLKVFLINCNSLL